MTVRGRLLEAGLSRLMSFRVLGSYLWLRISFVGTQVPLCSNLFNGGHCFLLSIINSTKCLVLTIKCTEILFYLQHDDGLLRNSNQNALNHRQIQFGSKIGQQSVVSSQLASQRSFISKIMRVYFALGKILNPCRSNILYYWANLHCGNRGQILKIITPSGHTDSRAGLSSTYLPAYLPITFTVQTCFQRT